MIDIDATIDKEPPEYKIEHTQAHVHVAFPAPRTVLSSAVLNGGFTEASHIVNLKVEKNMEGTSGPFEPSHVTLSNYCLTKEWNGAVVGMMTAPKLNRSAGSAAPNRE